MKVIRVTCPHCSNEKIIREEENDLKHYEEKLVSQGCPQCRNIRSAEDRLLEAMFGSQEEPYLW